MLNTNKLLYVLPDLAYLAELLPGKKEHFFEVQGFKQYNGKLIENGKFITENLHSLIRKLDEDEYELVLPDDLFTNTIINVERESEKEVKEYLKEEVIPSLHISSDSHQIQTFILSEYKGTYKVQLSTIQKSLLSPLKTIADSEKVKIKNIFPLSWVIKSLIPLEPSLSILQMGENLFMAKHYIGVDEPLVDSVDNLDRFVEAIKTMKGTEPSLQTVYLLTNETIETQLKEKLDGVLPLQQLAKASDDGAKVPGYIEKIITASMRTISIPDFEVPQFGIKDVESSVVELAEDLTNEKDSYVESAIFEEDDLSDIETELPKPGTIDEANSSKDIDLLLDDETEGGDEIKSEVTDLKSEDDQKDLVDESKILEEKLVTDEAQPKVIAHHKPTIVVNEDEDEDDGVDLSKFTSEISTTDQKIEEPVVKAEKAMPPKEVLKNNDGTGSFIKIFLIGLGSFLVTVAVGVGIGAGLLQLSQPKTEPVEEPQVEWTEPEQVEEPEPTPKIEIVRSEYSIRVVNATTKAGYAGQIASILEDKEYAEVDAKNAVEDYESGSYVLMNEEIEGLAATLSEDLGMELSFVEGAEAEDPDDEFDAVVVLAE